MKLAQRHRLVTARCPYCRCMVSVSEGAPVEAAARITPGETPSPTEPSPVCWYSVTHHVYDRARGGWVAHTWETTSIVYRLVTVLHLEEIT